MRGRARWTWSVATCRAIDRSHGRNRDRVTQGREPVERPREHFLHRVGDERAIADDGADDLLHRGNVTHVEGLERRGVAGVCLLDEDGLVEIFAVGVRRDHLAPRSAPLPNDSTGCYGVGRRGAPERSRRFS